ncbi:MAG: TolC family protein [Myxococcaceae bacterium]|nr:TolC family protein [Myxococcaceae bacterium]
MSALLLAVLLAAAPETPPGSSAAPGANATPITLEEARAEGRRNTQALLSLLDVERAEQGIRLSRASLLPQLGFSVSAGGAYSGRRRALVPVPDPSGEGFVLQEGIQASSGNGNYDISLNLSQVLYDRALWKQLEQSGVTADATRGQAQEQADASELEAINRFFNLYRTQATIQVLEATVRRSEEQLERARALFQAGRVGRGEELSALVNLGNDRINLVQRRSQLVTDQGQLAAWLARPGTTPLLAQDPGTLRETPAPAPALEQALSEARQRRPLIRALQQQVRVAELGRDIASAAYIPRLLGQGSYSRSGPNAGPVFSEPNLQNNVSGAVVLQWDLFSGFATRAQVSQAEASRRTAELNLTQAERELEASVRTAVESLQTQIIAARLAAENRGAAVQSLALAEERFKAGAGSTLEVRDAQLKLTQAELALLENRVNVEIARFALMRAVGSLSPGESK